MSRDVERPRERALEALLDKLVAAQLELEAVEAGKPFGGVGKETDCVAGAYSMLRSAILDLRGIIEQTDGTGAS